MIEVKNVSKSYLGKTILDNISFSIDNSSKIGLIGRNGIGKSTLLKILSQVEKPDSGIIDRNNLRLIGYLPQEIQLENDKLTVEEFIKKEMVNRIEKELGRIL